jgi:hypothetical protein
MRDLKIAMSDVADGAATDTFSGSLSADFPQRKGVWKDSGKTFPFGMK